MFENIVASAKSTKGLGTLIFKTQKNSPQLLFGAGIVGMVGTVVLSSRATLRSVDILKEHQANIATIDEAFALDTEEYTEKNKNRDKVVALSQTSVAMLKLYAPAVTLGVISVACLTQSHRVLTQRNVALASALTGVEKALDAYRGRVQDEIGVEREAKLWQPVEKVDVIDADGKKTKIEMPTAVGGSPYKVLFDPANKNWNPAHEYNQMFISAQQQFANDMLQAHGYVYLNDVYTMLGFERTKAGQIVGWVKGNGDDYIDFGIFNDLHEGMRFASGDERSIWLDFNVDGNILDLMS